MIGFANSIDLTVYAELGKRFHSQFHSWIGEFDPESFSGYWKDVLDRGYGFIMKRESLGFPSEAIGAYVFPDPRTSVTTGQIGFWFVTDKSAGLAGGLLFNSVMKELIVRGCKNVVFSIPAGGERSETITAFATKAGFSPIETLVGMEISAWQ